jgi:hypothetical protein
VVAASAAAADPPAPDPAAAADRVEAADARTVAGQVRVGDPRIDPADATSSLVDEAMLAATATQKETTSGRDARAAGVDGDSRVTPRADRAATEAIRVARRIEAAAAAIATRAVAVSGFARNAAATGRTAVRPTTRLVTTRATAVPTTTATEARSVRAEEAPGRAIEAVLAVVVSGDPSSVATPGRAVKAARAVVPRGVMIGRRINAVRGSIGIARILPSASATEDSAEGKVTAARRRHGSAETPTGRASTRTTTAKHGPPRLLSSSGRATRSLPDGGPSKRPSPLDARHVASSSCRSGARHSSDSCSTPPIFEFRWSRSKGER